MSIRQIINNRYLLQKHILIEAYVNQSHGIVTHGNWGDDLNYYFLREICRRRVLIYDHLSVAIRLRLKNYLVIGSIIDMLCKDNTEVWGAGIMYGSQRLKVKPQKVHAVRGPLTREVLLENGIECPEVYGDPALLIPLYYHPHIKKKYQYGIVSHVSNFELVKGFSISGEPLRNRNDVLIINLSNYHKWTDVIDDLCSCEAILSSSLHGLIVSEAYRIPNVWIEFGQSLVGGRFKFNDFFMSIGKQRENPYSVIDGIIDECSIREYLAQWEGGSIDLHPLVNACPFEIKAPLFEF